MRVPHFHQYYATVSHMNTEQRKFYDLWYRKWRQGYAIDINGQISYLFTYMNSIICNEEPRKVIKELRRLKRKYAHEEKIVEYCSSWISDTYVLIGKLDKAIMEFPIPKIGSKTSYQMDRLLSLKFARGKPISARELLTCFGAFVTKFGRENLNSVEQYVQVILDSLLKQEGIRLLETWANHSETQSSNGYPVLTGVHHPKVRLFHFSSNKTYEQYAKDLTRQAENIVRQEMGIPNVGEGWVSETELYYKIKNRFPHYRVEHHVSPEWLGRQHIDILIHDINVGIEYHGKQHDEPVAFFGGELAYLKTKQRDKKKLRLCRKHNVKLIYVRAEYSFDELCAEIIQESSI